MTKCHSCGKFISNSQDTIFNNAGIGTALLALFEADISAKTTSNKQTEINKWMIVCRPRFTNSVNNFVLFEI